MELRLATSSDLKELSELCFRSKASWGYDEAFMASCLDELTFKEEDLKEGLVAVAIENNQFLGVAHIVEIGTSGAALSLKQFELVKLFIDPSAFKMGAGRALFKWAVSSAQLLNASDLFIISDPYARPFYEKMGAFHTGHILSETMANRWLPFFIYPLKKL